MSAFPRDHLNGRPKLLFRDHGMDTCSLITGKINLTISQLLSVRPTLNISFPDLPLSFWPFSIEKGALTKRKGELHYRL